VPGVDELVSLRRSGDEDAAHKELIGNGDVAVEAAGERAGRGRQESGPAPDDPNTPSPACVLPRPPTFFETYRSSL
jgi:hypothetical protein